MKDAKLTIALAGNPNCGKTTIFNNLTGSRQHVGNYPGVTVEKKEGVCYFQGRKVLIVDLPGTYSLTAFSPEEVVTRNFIAQEKCDVLVSVVDAANLERNLYLTAQLLELERPVILALNMIDVAEGRGMEIRDDMLAQNLGVAVTRTVGSRNKGMDEILKAVIDVQHKGNLAFKIDYGPDIEGYIAKLEPMLAAACRDLKFPVRWLALKLLENDKIIVESVKKLSGGAAAAAFTTEAREKLQKLLGSEPELEIANKRYQFVGRLYRQAVTANDELVTVSDKIDKILTNRLFGLPIFLGMMWLVFNLVFTLGDYPKEWMDQGVKLFSAFVSQHMPEGELKSLVVDGAIGGVGSVIVFLPNILLLFLAIALLEDTGYMARAAFIMDRVMYSVGLHGKSFIPLLLGFGCNVPAIMGTRTLENPRDRLVTMLVAPLMSCSARLPVYTVLIAAFFSDSMAGNVLFSIYLLGIIMAVIMARIFRSVLFPGETEPFVMELPPYRMPSAKGILIHMWERSVLYLQKAGTIILAVSVIVWFLSNYPSEFTPSQDYEALAAQAETVFADKVAEEVTGPLNITNVEQNRVLRNMIDQIDRTEEECKAKTAELKNDSSTVSEINAQKEAKLKELEQTNPQLYALADRYSELKGSLEDEQDKLKKQAASEKMAQSYAGQIGRFVEPVIRPLGFDWKIGVGLFAGFTAKEVLVSSLGTIYSVGEADENSVSLKEALAANPMFNPLVAYALMVFVLVYSPCLATIAVIKRETNSWKWALFSSLYSTVLAWILSFIVYHGGQLLGLGG